MAESTRARPTPDFSLSFADEPILLLFPTYHLLTAAQVAQLLYAKGDGSNYDPRKYASSRLKPLTDARYLQANPMPKIRRFGSTPLVYRLARRGINYLETAHGIPYGLRYHSKEGQHSYRYYEHTLSLNEFLIQVALLTRNCPDIHINALVHERLFKADPAWVRVSVSHPDGTTALQTVKLEPDAWLDLRFGNQLQQCYEIECDTGTEQRVKWQTKIASLISWVEAGAYQKRFHTDSLRFIVVVIPGESIKIRYQLTTLADQRTWASKRVDQLRAWTVDELNRLQMTAYAEFFRFGVFLPQTLSPAGLLLGESFVDLQGSPIAFLEQSLVQSQVDIQPEEEAARGYL
ncbi:replication-relaxation family protein [Nitrolancea hollandica]|uniref:Uncharacterized protein n=1 Tax=Nitrolancea hollandica Lb TaxID=1129897 RepID=I4ELA6_9BACT|nr:replication-relaxation family protein [Nitrolancea hollandica]CCF85468.1 hypothetical protein NITHO_500003 [Nitrolancea hollandica Lb]